jgi:multidrug efflux pump subunit AcrA (membrane-fusion protein)
MLKSSRNHRPSAKARGAARIVIPVIILLTGAAAYAALRATRPEPKPIDPQEKAWTVVTESVAPQALSPNLRLFGRTESPKTARLTSSVEADVLDVPAREGDRVRAGQLLVSLDDREVALLLAQHQAEINQIAAEIELEKEKHANDLRTLEHEQQLLTLARKEVERAQRLVNSNVGSQSQLDAARQTVERQTIAVNSRELTIRQHRSVMVRLESRLRQAEAVRDRSGLDLERTRVSAPFDGRLTEVSVSIGDRVKNGDPLVSMYDTSALEIRAQVPTASLPLVRQSLLQQRPLRARSRVDGISVEAVLDRISGEVRTGSGGADALFRILDGSPWLPLGRTVELVVELPPVADAIALPLEALYGTGRIYLFDDGQMKGITVKRLGEIHAGGRDRRVLVRSDRLRPGDRVIVTQLPNAIDGLRVRVADGE